MNSSINLLVTDKAVEKILALRNEAGLDHGTPLRIGIKGGGCSGMLHDLFFDDGGQREGDLEMTLTDSLVLLIDPASAMYLEGTTLDYIDNGLMGSGFKFSNDNIKSTCGCGQSFSV